MQVGDISERHFLHVDEQHIARSGGQQIHKKFTVHLPSGRNLTRFDTQQTQILVSCDRSSSLSRVNVVLNGKTCQKWSE